MPSKNATPTYKRGDKVRLHYRSATAYGTVTGVNKPATTKGNITYSIRPHKRHVSDSGSKEPAIIHRKGKNLTKVSSFPKGK